MSSIFYLLLSLPLIILLFFLHKNHKNTQTFSRLPPGPRGLPFIGNLLDVDASAPHRSLWQLSQTYGPVTFLKQGRVRVLVISSARMAEEVMKTHDLIFCGRPSQTGIQTLTYNHCDIAFAPYEDRLREMKKTCVVHLFSFKRVQSFHGVREYEVSKLIEKISKSSLDSTPFNLSEAIQSMTSAIICRTAFGKKFQDDDGAKWSSKLELLVKESDAMFTGFFYSDHFPFLGFLDRLTGMISRLQNNHKESDAFYQKIIDEHLDPKRVVKAEQEDILDVLLRFMKEGSFKTQLSLDRIKAVLMNIVIGGTNTSASTVVWAMTYLMKNPDKMRKAQKEVRQTISNKGFVKEEDIGKLTYLKAVIKEIMRLQPPIPLIPRKSIQKCSLGGYEIPAHTRVIVNAWAIGRDTKVWGDNPEEFMPERFIGKYVINMKGRNFGLIPFGAGRRICPGIHMGLATVELSLANLLYTFEWEIPAGMKTEDLDMEVTPGITMHKKNALRLVPKKVMCG